MSEVVYLFCPTVRVIHGKKPARVTSTLFIVGLVFENIVLFKLVWRLCPSRLTRKLILIKVQLYILMSELQVLKILSIGFPKRILEKSTHLPIL